MANNISWKKRFAEFYNEVSACEPPEESQLDEVLKTYQDQYFDAADVPKSKLQCSACGNTEPQHLKFVLETGRCVV
jgi:hypothetical protein